MLKKTKFFMLVAFVLMLFLGTSVNATEINSAEDLVTFFEGKEVTITGNTVKLNANVAVEDVLDLMEGEYIFDLNGKTLKIPEVYVLGGKLTINGTTNGAKFDSHYVSIEGQNSSLVADGVAFETDDTYIFDGDEEELKTLVDNFGGGTVVIKNSTIEDSIWNTEGHMTLENVTVPIICQQGDAVIKGGKYESFSTDLTLGKTTIYGGEFINKGEETHAFIINNTKEVKPFTIDELLPEGYVATFESFESEYYEYDGIENYTGFWNNNVRIIKEEELSKVYSDTFKKITADGTWEIDALKPNGVLESESLLSSIASKIVKGTGYEATAYAYCPGEEFSADAVLVCLYKDGETEEHIVKAKYLDPTESEKAKAVSQVLSKMKYWELNTDMDVDNAYILDDLYLINYLFANTGTSRIKGEQALNFSKDLIAATGGANISFEYYSRLGGANPYELYSYSAGEAIVLLDGQPISSRYAALTASHVLYVPEGEYKDTDAYIAAALERIETYIGKDAINDAKFKITHGGKIDEIPEVGNTYNKYNLFDDTKAGDNYYVVEINGKVYNFVICEKEADKLEEPKYVGINLGNNITITTDSTSVPLDTAISVKTVTDNSIKKALGKDAYAAYDISLYSNAKNDKITNIDDGNFKVTIPIPENLIDKDITVYYMSDDGKINDYKGTPDGDGYITFETNHFSTYIIAEKGAGVSNPNTSDNVLIAVATLALSMVGVVVAIKCIKK